MHRESLSVVNISMFCFMETPSEEEKQFMGQKQFILHKDVFYRMFFPPFIL